MLDKAVHVTPNSELFKAYDLQYKRDVAVKKIIIEGNNPKEVNLNLKKAKNEVASMISVSYTHLTLPTKA